MSSVLSPVSLYDLQPSTGSGVQLNGSTGATAPKQTPVPAPAPQTDTVKLSVTQQVRNLHSEGEGPGQIANSLGLTSSQVTGDLYVSLTWPQLLSKVASSTLNLGADTSDSGASGAVASGAASSATAATAGNSDAVFPGVPAFGASKSAASHSGTPAFGAAKSDGTSSGVFAPAGLDTAATKDAVAA